MGFAERFRSGARTLPQPGRVGIAAWDLAEREPVLQGATRQVLAASTVKVLVLIAVLRRVESGRLALDAEVELPVQRAGGSGVLRELCGVGELQVGDLLRLMIVVSDNAATNALLDLVGFAAVGQCAEELGATGTQVVRRMMDVHAPGRNVTTALDQARVLDALARGRALGRRGTEFALGVLARQQVRDRLPALLPDGARCWNKTGEVRGLRHDVGLVGDRRPRAVIAVLVDELTDDRSNAAHGGGPACDFIAQLGRLAHSTSRQPADHSSRS